VLVENAGFGARAAAPVARKVLDYYLLGKPVDKPLEPAHPPGKAHRQAGATRACAASLPSRRNPLQRPRRTKPMIRHLLERLTAKIDGPLFAVVACLLVLGLATLYSAAYQAPARSALQVSTCSWRLR